MARVVVVGASLGGLRTAESLRRSGYTDQIVVVGAETHLPYNRPPLSKEVLSTVVTHEAVAFPQRAATEDVEWVRGVSAVSTDLDAHNVVTAHGGAMDFREDPHGWMSAELYLPATEAAERVPATTDRLRELRDRMKKAGTA